MNISLASRNAIVTGAARGIGRAIAEKLAASGSGVFLTDIDERTLESSCQAIRQTNAKAEFLAGDLTAADFPSRLVDETLAKLGSIDIIVNNAGYTWDNVIQKTSDQQFQSMLDIHVIAPFRLLRAASGWIRETAKREAGQGNRIMRKVVNITSISGLDGNPGQAGYSSGKAAVVGLTKTLAKEWGRYSVNVNAVGFGLIDTRLTRPFDDPETQVVLGEKSLQVGMQQQVREQIPKQIPLGRLGTPDEAADAVFFFCSPLSDYVTGEVLVCGGGLHF